MLTGSCLIGGTIVYSSVRNFIPLEIPFYDHDKLVLVRTTYGWCFWMNLVNGIVCLTVGAVVLFMDLRYPDVIATFFGIDVLQDYDEVYDVQVPAKKDTPAAPVTEKARLATNNTPMDYGTDGPEYEAPALRKRTVYNRFQRSSVRKPTPAPRRNPLSTVLPTATEEEDENPIYENALVPQSDRYDAPGDSVTDSKENILMATLKI